MYRQALPDMKDTTVRAGEWRWDPGWEITVRVARERKWRAMYKSIRASGLDAARALELLLDPCPTAVSAADVGYALLHHAEASTAAGLRSATRDAEMAQLQLRRVVPTTAVQHTPLISAQARRRQQLDPLHPSGKSNHLLSLRRREYMGRLCGYPLFNGIFFEQRLQSMSNDCVDDCAVSSAGDY